MHPIIKTERLYLRELTPADATSFYQLNLDPEVIQFTGDEPFASVNAAQEFLENYMEYKKHGYGRWAVCLLENNAFIGFCGLKYHPKEALTELGFRIFKNYWNQGYATESALGCLDYGFKNLGLKAIYAHAHRKNKASDRVLNKIGFQRIKSITYDEQPAYLYVLEAKNYA